MGNRVPEDQLRENRSRVADINTWQTQITLQYQRILPKAHVLASEPAHLVRFDFIADKRETLSRNHSSIPHQSGLSLSIACRSVFNNGHSFHFPSVDLLPLSVRTVALPPPSTVAYQEPPLPGQSLNGSSHTPSHKAKARAACSPLAATTCTWNATDLLCLCHSATPHLLSTSSPSSLTLRSMPCHALPHMSLSYCTLPFHAAPAQPILRTAAMQCAGNQSLLSPHRSSFKTCTKDP